MVVWIFDAQAVELKKIQLSSKLFDIHNLSHRDIKIFTGSFNSQNGSLIELFGVVSLAFVFTSC